MINSFSVSVYDPVMESFSFFRRKMLKSAREFVSNVFFGNKIWGYLSKKWNGIKSVYSANVIRFSYSVGFHLVDLRDGNMTNDPIDKFLVCVGNSYNNSIVKFSVPILKFSETNIPFSVYQTCYISFLGLGKIAENRYRGFPFHSKVTSHSFYCSRGSSGQHFHKFGVSHRRRIVFLENIKFVIRPIVLSFGYFIESHVRSDATVTSTKLVRYLRHTFCLDPFDKIINFFLFPIFVHVSSFITLDTYIVSKVREKSSYNRASVVRLVNAEDATPMYISS